MQDLYQSFINVDNTFWGDDIFRWWFYIAIILILIFEKQRITKITIAWYSIVFLIGLFNPLSNWIMSKVAPAWQYRARLYSMLPIPQVIALGSILLIDKFCRVYNKSLTEQEIDNHKWPPVAKLVIVGAVCIVIVIGGTDVYKQDWMKPAQNLEKVPPAVLELKEKLGDQEDICVAVPDSLSSYLRQVAPEFYTPYGRYINSLGAVLSQENPDPMDAMTEAGLEGVNFIVIYDNETNKENFHNTGYEYYDRVSGYLIYKVEGVKYSKKIYNERHQLVRVMNLDENGEAIVNKLGYAGIEYEYDEKGSRCKEIYLNPDGSRAIITRGYSAIARTYTYFSRKVASLKYLDQNDQTILVNGRYETRYDYDLNRRLVKESYYDQYGNPMILMDELYSSKGIEYDNKDHIIGEQYYDKDGKHVNSALGYAAYAKEYDQYGNEIRETYFGSDGQKKKIAEGYASITRTFNDGGFQTSEMYLDESDNPVNAVNGYAQIRWEWNEAGQLIAETYWGSEGEPCIISEDYHGFIRTYTETGKEYIELYIDTFEKETPCGAGYSQVLQEYNENNRLIRESYYLYGEPYVVRTGYATLLREYNENNKLTSESYLDPQGLPVKCSKGYASLHRDYDAFGRIICESYYDENGNLTLCTRGFAKIERDYDAHGNIKEERFFDTNGLLVE